jgi:uridine kinase
MTLKQLLDEVEFLENHVDDPIVMASINGRRTCLAEPLWGEERIRVIRLHDAEADTTIQRTLLFILAVAAEEMYPDHRLWVNFSYGAGMYCELRRDEPLTEKEIINLEKLMKKLVKRDLEISPQVFGLRALLKMYQRSGDMTNFTTAKYIRRDRLTLYRMEGSQHLYFGRQLPSTGFVKAFRLVPESPGFVLLPNIKRKPLEIPTYCPQPKLLRSQREYTSWSERLGVQDVGQLNEYIVNGRSSDLIQVAEARHTKFFVEAAEQVADLPEQGRLVLLAGPSSSGKTSSAKRLMVQLRVLGCEPFALSLDNYFVDRQNTPLGRRGRLRLRGPRGASRSSCSTSTCSG